jgi:hypothetical protein
VLGVRRLRAIACGSLAALALLIGPAASEVGVDETKAVFLYNFAKFVQWPADAFQDSRAPLVVGVVGTDAFGDVLANTMNGKKVNGRLVEVRSGRTLDALGRCHILYIGGSEEERLAQLLEAVSPSVVTVGEIDAFLTSGGILQIAIIQNRVRFAINTARAEQAGVRISSKVLTLSRIVVSRS